MAQSGHAYCPLAGIATEVERLQRWSGSFSKQMGSSYVLRATLAQMLGQHPMVPGITALASSLRD